MPNFPETSPQDFYAQEVIENEPEQVQEFPEIQEVPVQNSQISNQNQEEVMPSYQTPPQNDAEDILLQSSLGSFNSGATYTTQMLPNEIETEIAPPIYESDLVQNNNNIGQNINMGIYNNPNAISSYSYPERKNYISNNPQFATVSPINNDEFNAYDNQYINNINPQTENFDQKIIYSTPIQIRPNIINQNNINNSPSPFKQSNPKITPINYINSNNSNISAGFENDIINNNNITKGMKNLNLGNKNKEVTIKLKGNNNNINNNLNRTNINSRNNNNKIKNEDIFNRESWKYFYQENDPFFIDLNDFEDSIPNQRIENPGRNEVYIGEINRTKQKHGYGKLITPEYEREGTWKNNRFNGWGRETRKNGEIYEGKFVNDILNGKGKYKKGNILYVGDFVNYERQGKGELFTDEYHYTGDFKRNGFNGYGRIELYDIGVYEGYFQNNDINGYGIFKYNNGDFYEGDMVERKKEGNGRLKTADGKILEGEFYNDEYVDENKYKYNGKKSYYKKNYK